MLPERASHGGAACRGRLAGPPAAQTQSRHDPQDSDSRIARSADSAGGQGASPSCGRRAPLGCANNPLEWLLKGRSRRPAILV